MIDLKRYLPDYYEEVKETNYLMEAENPELALLWEAVKQVKSNQFILDADNSTVKKWEKLLKIYPDYSVQSLEYRKSVVIMRLSTRAPLTHRWLIDKLEETAGEGNYRIDLDYNAYSLDVCLINDFKNLIQELRYYLREKIPANLLLTTSTEIHTEPYEINIIGSIHNSLTTTPIPEFIMQHIYNVNLSFIPVHGIVPNISITKLPQFIMEYEYNYRFNIVASNYQITETYLPQLSNH